MVPVVLYQYTAPMFFYRTTMEIKLHSFFVLSLPLHLMKNFFTTILMNLYLYTLKILDLFVMAGEIYLLAYFTNPTWRFRIGTFVNEKKKIILVHSWKDKILSWGYKKATLVCNGWTKIKIERGKHYFCENLIFQHLLLNPSQNKSHKNW